jgi:hypothetical protein
MSDLKAVVLYTRNSILDELTVFCGKKLKQMPVFVDWTHKWVFLS